MSLRHATGPRGTRPRQSIPAGAAASARGEHADQPRRPARHARPAPRTREGGATAPKAEQTLHPGDLIEILMPGGGGYGPPAERDLALRTRDRLEGYVISS
jgi:N-methylhydantoinase B